MSYNTRRTQGGRGQPPPQTQVNYHQGNIGSSIGRGGRIPPNQGYNTTPVTQSFTPQPFVSQGYSTTPLPAPAPAPAPQKSSPPVTAAPAQPVALSTPQPAPQISTSPTPLLKTEVVASTAPEQQETNGEGAPPPQKPHWMKKGPGVKLSRKTRKLIKNARLRRILIPKNSLMFLNELHSGAKFTCQERLNALSQFVYTVTVEVDGKVFTGQGMSKLAAKSQASENALKVLVLEKMAKTQMDTSASESTAGDDVEMEDDSKESVCGDEGSVAESSGRRKPLPEDELPWGSLAAFALHKLFAEWQQQGTPIPLAKTPNISTYVGELFSRDEQKVLVPSPMKKIPEDATKRHPVSLLNQLKPGSTYKESHEGTLPNMIFTFTVTIDGKDFSGTGNSKREAKKECAKAALASMGIQSEV